MFFVKMIFYIRSKRLTIGLLKYNMECALQRIPQLRGLCIHTFGEQIRSTIFFVFKFPLLFFKNFDTHFCEPIAYYTLTIRTIYRLEHYSQNHHYKKKYKSKTIMTFIYNEEYGSKKIKKKKS